METAGVFVLIRDSLSSLRESIKYLPETECKGKTPLYCRYSRSPSYVYNAGVYSAPVSRRRPRCGYGQLPGSSVRSLLDRES